MRTPHDTPGTRPRRWRIACALVGVVVASLVLATGAVAGDGDIAGGTLELGGVEGSALDPSGTERSSGGGSIVPGEGEDAGVDDATGIMPNSADQPITGTDAQLDVARAQLVVERNKLQAALVRQEQRRTDADLRHDAAVEAYATHLVDLFDAGGNDERIRELMAARDEQDPDERTRLTGLLMVADRPFLVELDAASTQAATLGQVADATRERIMSIGTRIAAIDAVITERKGPNKAALERARGERFTIDADYVFTTGPIPSIGYWGAMDGGGMLTGWTGFIGAAVGGVGCTPPDPAMRPTGTVESGEASWYGPGFQGNNTANGETFDTNTLTAAHKTLPFGTIVRVYSSTTARCVFVRINDRGPYIDGRVIDLSRAAADAIGMESVAPVQLEVYARP